MLPNLLCLNHLALRHNPEPTDVIFDDDRLDVDVLVSILERSSVDSIVAIYQEFEITRGIIDTPGVLEELATRFRLLDWRTKPLRVRGESTDARFQSWVAECRERDGYLAAFEGYWDALNVEDPTSEAAREERAQLRRRLGSSVGAFALAVRARRMLVATRRITEDAVHIKLLDLFEQQLGGTLNATIVASFANSFKDARQLVGMQFGGWPVWEFARRRLGHTGEFRMPVWWEAKLRQAVEYEQRQRELDRQREARRVALERARAARAQSQQESARRLEEAMQDSARRRVEEELKRQAVLEEAQRLRAFIRQTDRNLQELQDDNRRRGEEADRVRDVLEGVRRDLDRAALEEE